jgi:hypothetical protein
MRVPVQTDEIRCIDFFDCQVLELSQPKNVGWSRTVNRAVQSNVFNWKIIETGDAFVLSRRVDRNVRTFCTRWVEGFAPGFASSCLFLGRQSGRGKTGHARIHGIRFLANLPTTQARHGRHTSRQQGERPKKRCSSLS